MADIAAIASLTNTTAAPATADANAAGGTTFAALLQLLQPSAGQISNPTPANDLGQLVAQNDNGAIATVGQTASGQNALANAPVTAATITQSNLIALLQTGDANPPAATGVTTTAPTSAAQQPAVQNDNTPNGQSASGQNTSSDATATGATATPVSTTQPDLIALLQNGGTNPPAATDPAPPSATDQQTDSTVATLQAQPADTLAAAVQTPSQTAAQTAASPTGATKAEPGAKDDQTDFHRYGAVGAAHSRPDRNDNSQNWCKGRSDRFHRYGAARRCDGRQRAKLGPDGDTAGHGHDRYGGNPAKCARRTNGFNDRPDTIANRGRQPSPCPNSDAA